MKRFIFTIATIFTLSSSVYYASAREVAVNIKSIPEKAQTFVKTNFADKKIVSVVKDSEIVGTDYTVYFSDGTKIEFTSKGEWTNIDAQHACLPQSVLPVAIASYVTENHEGICACQIEIDKEFMSFQYKVELQNGIDLRFDKNGGFLGFDD